MLRQRITEDLQTAVNQLGYKVTDIVLSIPKNTSFGDYSTNLALQLAKLDNSSDKQSPIEIANKIITYLDDLSYLSKIEIAGGGFINFFIKDEQLIKNLKNEGILEKSESPKKILVEYGHVNPFKEIHIGHLRTFILGESICRIFEALGYSVFRANYQGDIGLHIAKAIWGIKKSGLPSNNLNFEEKAKFLGQAYAEGNKAYEAEPAFKKEIDQINTQLYQKDPEVKEVYELARNWSLEYFEPVYKLLGVKYDRCFFESEVYARGKEIVLANINTVFDSSDGAIIFPGERYGLHNRVFITSAGNATYEGKEIGLAELEYSVFNYDQAIHVVAHEQAGYFQVVFKAIEMIFPHLKNKKYHLSYGLVDLKAGKMSSRTGDVYTVDDLYKVVSEKVREVMKKSKGEIDQNVVKQISLGAIKFSYLKFSPAPNMVFDLEESVSLNGDSGPYVQYTYSRIQSVLKKAKKGLKVSNETALGSQERKIARHLLYFIDYAEEAAVIYHPNLLASYLIELAKLYNLFYQECRIIGSDKEQFRLKLSFEVGQVLKKGLYLLGIDAPERM